MYILPVNIGEEGEGGETLNTAISWIVYKSHTSETQRCLNQVLEHWLFILPHSPPPLHHTCTQ